MHKFDTLYFFATLVTYFNSFKSVFNCSNEGRLSISIPVLRRLNLSHGPHLIAVLETSSLLQSTQLVFGSGFCSFTNILVSIESSGTFVFSITDNDFSIFSS